MRPRIPTPPPSPWRGAAGIGPGDLVLDAGCGVGGPAIAIARDLGAIVHGVTISPVQVRLGRVLAAEAGVADRVHLHLADFHQLPFADERFDAVMVMEATCYSDDLSGLIGELARVLRPGGTLVREGRVPTGRPTK